jgi:Fic family protein
LNLSDWFNHDKERYRDELLILSQQGDFDRLVKHFSEAIIGQAEKEIARIEELIRFRKDLLAKLKERKERGVVLNLAEDLLATPVLTANRIAETYKVTYPLASSAVRKLVKMGVLKEMTGKKYNRIYVCMDVLRTLERKM